MNMKEWMGQVLTQKERLAIPIMTHPGIELIGKSVREAVIDGKVHFEAIQALNEKYPSAACTVIMDLTVEAEAFGAEIIFPEDEIPTVSGRLLDGLDPVKKMNIPGMDRGRLPQYLLANRLAAESISDKPVFGGCIGPFSLAGRLYDMSEMMMACYCEPETAKALLSKCSSFLTDYCLEIKKQGVNGVIIAEPAAGLLSVEGCDEFSSQYIIPIIKAVQDDSFIVVLHNCGNTGHCTSAMLNTGANAYHFGNMIDMCDVLRECPSDVLVMGNIDPVGVFRSATSGQVEQSVKELLDATSSYANFILSSGCDIPPHTPLSNIAAFYKALEEYNIRG
ncbi:MAG: uroporphyrinogen decarboxylase family protein [Bacteroidales bacterium]|jgi:uroporphyrinogen decarboxylase|nr:uroporphyrinogen decarboxylase family protein [Bacteroidales bacterium]